MKINHLPKKYQKLWQKCRPLLKQGRPGDDEHAKEVVDLILNYRGKLKLDKDILIPVAMMHDIGHSGILPEHFKYVTGPEKIANGKLAHMLIGAKIANDILAAIKYDKKKSKEIVEIIAIHDADQLEDIKHEEIYNTINKKIFHDLDSLDRYTEKRIRSLKKIYKDRRELIKLLDSYSDNFFLKEFKDEAKKRMKKLIR